MAWRIIGDKYRESIISSHGIIAWRRRRSIGMAYGIGETGVAAAAYVSIKALASQAVTA